MVSTRKDQGFDIENNKNPRKQINISHSKFNNTHAKLLYFFSSNFKCDKDVLLSSAIESTVALTWASITTSFLTKNTNWYFHPFTIASTMLIANFIIRAHKMDRDYPDYAKLNSIKRIIRSTLFAGADVFNRATIIHEAGHAWVSLLVYLAQPEICITLLDGGSTVYKFDNLNNTIMYSEFGTMLGEEKSRALISGAGPGAQLLWDYGLMMLAQLISNKHPEIKSHLRFMAVCSILKTACYAISAGSCESANDFCSLDKNAKISPVVAISFIVGSALLLQLLLSSCTKIKSCYLESKNAAKSPLLLNSIQARCNPIPLSINNTAHQDEATEDQNRLLSRSPKR